MGTNNSLSLQESWHLPPSSISLAGQTLESLACLTTLCLPSFLALPLFLPILPLHSPSTRETTKRNGVSSSTVTRSQTPSLQNFNIPSGVVPGHRTAFAWSQLQQRERQWQRAYQRRPTALETQKNDRDRNTLTTGNSLHVHSSRVVDSRQNLDANQSN